MIMLRFIFALAVHTATTSAATVSVKDGADEGHRQLSDCRQRQGHNPITGSCCNFCDNPGNGVDKPWWSPGANAKCDRDDLACAGCSECKTNCRQREGHDQRTGSCCNFCDNPGNGVDRPWKVGANAKCHRDDIACSSCSQCEGCLQDVKNQGEDISSWRSRVHERQRQLALCLPSARLLAGCPHAQGKRHAQSHVGAMLTVAHTFACSCTELPAGSICTNFYSSYSSIFSNEKTFRECTNPSPYPTRGCLDCPGTPPYTCVSTDMRLTDPSLLCPP